jgi:hypothetical protein
MRVALVLIAFWLGCSFGAADAAAVTDDLQCYKITNQSLKAVANGRTKANVRVRTLGCPTRAKRPLEFPINLDATPL